MLVDSSLGDAYAEIDFGSDESNVWLQYEVRFEADSLAQWMTVDNFSGNFHVLLANDHSDQLDYMSINPDGWFAYNAFPALDLTPVADAWMTVEVNRVTEGTDNYYFDGTLVGSGTDIDSNDTRWAQIGQVSAQGVAPGVCYIRNVRIGTSRHGTQLFAWPDTETDLSAWTNTEGDVSVIDNPFPPEYTGAVTFAVSFSMTARGHTFTLFPSADGTLTLTPSSDGTLTLVPV